MKHKATEVREKRTRKTLKGKSKVQCRRSLSDDSEEEILEADDPHLSKELQRIDRMNEKISKTSEDVWRMPTSSGSPPTKKSPFVTRESSAFATLTEVCGGVNKYEWSDDSEEDKTNALKMEIPPSDGRNVEKYADKFGRYLVLTGKAKAKDRVKANLIVQGIKDPELQERVSKLLQTATIFDDFLKKLQDLYPTLETDLSILGEISKVSHLPYDPKPEQVVKLLETLERLFDKLNPAVMTEERKLMELSSKRNNELFVEWTKDDNLFARMQSYGSLKDLMKERAQLSVGFKHLAASRGSASGRTASSRYQEKQRDKEKDTSFSGGPSSGSSAPKADISVLLSQCHSMIAELRVSEREGKGDKGGKGSGKEKGRGRGKGQGGTGGKGQLDSNVLVTEFKARIQCKHCCKTNHYSDHCFDIQRKQRVDRLKTFLIQSGLSEEAAQKAVDNVKKKWKDETQKGPKAGTGKKDASGPSAASAGAGAPSAETKRMQEDTESQAKKRKRDLAFSEVEKIVDLLRAAVKDGLTLLLPVVVEEEMCDAVLDTGATDSIVASSLVSDPNRRGYCVVKVGDRHYTYSEEEKSVDVCMGNFNLPHVCIVMETSAFQVCLGMNFVRQNARTILGFIFTPSRLIETNPETDELCLVSVSEKSWHKEGRKGMPPPQSSLRISSREAYSLLPSLKEQVLIDLGDLRPTVDL